MFVYATDPLHWKTRWSNEEKMPDVTDWTEQDTWTWVVKNSGDLLQSKYGEEYTKTAEKEVEPIDKEVVAMLVYKGSQEGCVRIIGPTVKNIITGQGDDQKILLVFIEKGEKGWIYGQPRVRFYRRINGPD